MDTHPCMLVGVAIGRSDEPHLLVVRNGTAWQLPEAPTYTQLKAYCAKHLGNYRFMSDLYHWRCVHGAECYHVILEKTSPNNLHRQNGGPLDAECMPFDTLLSFPNQITRAVITQLMVEEKILRRS